mmetsp:Transcript_13730/g.22961  ORF Transcript_13730/g.22961 Transcript_13730/m.22961 type:complete len:416 (-) Transcript_13730:376-1623(-)
MFREWLSETDILENMPVPEARLPFVSTPLLFPKFKPRLIGKSRRTCTVAEKQNNSKRKDDASETASEGLLHRRGFLAAFAAVGVFSGVEFIKNSGVFDLFYDRELTETPTRIRQAFTGEGKRQREMMGKTGPATRPDIDGDLASLVLRIPEEVINELEVMPVDEFRSEMTSLREKKLKLFKRKRPNLKEDIRNADYLDFLSYLQFKTVADHVRSRDGRETFSTICGQKMFIDLALLNAFDSIQRPAYEMQLEGETFGFPIRTVGLATNAVSQCQQGLNSILKYFKTAGFIGDYSIEWSMDREDIRDLLAASVGPQRVFAPSSTIPILSPLDGLTVTLTEPALLRSSQLLMLTVDKDFQQHFVAGVIQAYFRLAWDLDASYLEFFMEGRNDCEEDVCFPSEVILPFQLSRLTPPSQ